MLALYYGTLCMPVVLYYGAGRTNKDLGDLSTYLIIYTIRSI